jgi:cell division septation protein DedD
VKEYSLKLKPVVNEPNTSSNTLYRVQVGAFSKRENAEALVKKLKAAGFDAIIKSEN